MNLSKKRAEVEQRKNVSVGMTQKEKGIVSFFSERESIPSDSCKVNVHSVIEGRCEIYANRNGV